MPSLTQLHFEEVARPFFEAIANGKGKVPKTLREAIGQLLKNEKRNKEREVNVEMMMSSEDDDDDRGNVNNNNNNNTSKKRKMMKNDNMNQNSDADSGEEEDIWSAKQATHASEAYHSQ